MFELTARRSADYGRSETPTVRGRTVAQGWKTLVAATVMLLALLTTTASAQQPVTPLGGQLRLTKQGAEGDANVDAETADIAYNSVRNEFLVVFENAAATDTEIFGRRLAADGSPLAPAFQISGVEDDDDGFIVARAGGRLRS